VFRNELCNGFKATISVNVNGNSKYSLWEINGVLLNGNWTYNASFTGDSNTDVDFQVVNDIVNSVNFGKIQYKNTNVNVTTFIRYRATTSGSGGHDPVLNENIFTEDRVADPFMQNALYYAQAKDSVGYASGLTYSNNTLNVSSLSAGNLKVSTITTGALYVDGVRITANGGGPSSWKLDNSDLSYTSGSVIVNNFSAGNVEVSAISTASLFVGGVKIDTNGGLSSQWVDGELSSISYTSGNVTVNNFSAGSIGVSVASAGTLYTPTANVGTINATTLTSANLGVSVITTGTLFVGGVKIDTNGGLSSQWINGGSSSISYTSGNVNVNDFSAGSIGVSVASAGTLYTPTANVGTVNATTLTSANLGVSVITTGALFVGGVKIDTNGGLSSQWVDGESSSISYTSGNVTVNNFSAGSIGAAVVSAGTLQAPTINVATVNATTINTISLTSGSFSAGVVSAGTLSILNTLNAPGGISTGNFWGYLSLRAPTISTGSLEASSFIQAQSIRSNSMTSGSLGAGVVSAGTLYTSNVINAPAGISAGSIFGSLTLRAPSIMTGSFDGTSIQGSTVTVSSISTGSLRVTGDFLLSDGTQNVLSQRKVSELTPNVDNFQANQATTISGLNSSSDIALNYSGGSILAVFNSTTFKISTDGGSSFTNKTISGSGNFKNCAVSSDFTVHALIDNNKIYVSNDSGATYTSKGSSAYTLTAVHVSSDGTYIAAGYNSGNSVYILESTNSGTTFSDVNVALNNNQEVYNINSYINNTNNRVTYVSTRNTYLYRRIGNNNWSLIVYASGWGGSNSDSGRSDISDNGKYVTITGIYGYWFSDNYGESFTEIVWDNAGEGGGFGNYWPVRRVYFSNNGQYKIVRLTSGWKYSNNFGEVGSWKLGDSAVNGNDVSAISKDGSVLYSLFNSSDVKKYVNQNMGTLVTKTSINISDNLNTIGSLIMNANGNIGIGTKSPSYQLQLSTDSAGKPNGGSWANSSDERLKENIEIADLDICYDIIKNLPLKRYRWKDSSYTDDQIDDRNVVGFIAQDVVSVFPKAVNTKPFTNVDGTILDDCLSLNETMIIRTLYGAVQKLMSINEDLEERISQLENK
jgi:hypothetical protein